MFSGNFCSGRSQRLFALCENKPSPTLSEASAASSCMTLSPVPSLFDAVFEASAICVAINKHRDERRVNSVKREWLFSSRIEGHSPTLLSSNAAETIFAVTRFLPSNESCDTQTTDNIYEVSSVSPTIHDVVSPDQGIEKKGPKICVHQEGVPRLKLYPYQKKVMAAKLVLNAGKEHLTTKGKLKKALLLKPPCMDSCKRCAKPKLSLSERLEVNTKFWTLQDHVKQWKFINESVTCTIQKTKSCTPGAKGERLCSRVYSLRGSWFRRTVCETMYKNTLHICDSWINTALSHFSTSEVPYDKRGKQKSRRLKLDI